ncbi:hypothetical protein [Streptomyces anulatus]|uniref:hypothetical protein n=1 Tax=Streptomyces anulatus TaxID=1892 RepID=UPI003698F0C7
MNAAECRDGLLRGGLRCPDLGVERGQLCGYVVVTLGYLVVVLGGYVVRARYGVLGYVLGGDDRTGTGTSGGGGDGRDRAGSGRAAGDGQ